MKPLSTRKTNKPVEVEATTKVDLIRNWKVVDVDDKGVATLEMSIASMRMERKAGSDEDVFDSTKPDDLNKNELAKHVGPVLAVLRIDPQGKLVEVKESKVGPATRFATDLPFKLVLPESVAQGRRRVGARLHDPTRPAARHRREVCRHPEILGAAERRKACCRSARRSR